MSEMEKVNAFDVIRKMSEEGNKKLRLAPLGNIIAVDQKGKRCTMTIGVEAEDVKNHMLNKIGYGGLLLIDKEAFEETQKKMSEERAALADIWIRSKDDFPEKHTHVLVWVPTREMAFMAIRADRGLGEKWESEYEEIHEGISHWRPMPAGPGKTPQP